MKKYILITLLVLTVQIHAAVTQDFGFDNGAGIDTINSSGADTNNSAGADTNNSSGADSNVMLGGSDNGGATGAGLGNQDTVYNSELNRTSPFSQNETIVPKLSLLGIVNWLAGIINQLVYLILGASLVVFLYGILKLSFIDGQKPEAREQARKFMFWGIVSLFVMVSVWGLVNILKVSLFGNSPLIMPQLK